MQLPRLMISISIKMNVLRVWRRPSWPAFNKQMNLDVCPQLSLLLVRVCGCSNKIWFPPLIIIFSVFCNFNLGWQKLVMSKRCNMSIGCFVSPIHSLFSYVELHFSFYSMMSRI